MPGKRIPKGRDIKSRTEAASLRNRRPSTIGNVRGSTPNLTQVYAAVDEGHISHEEAKDLNPNYNPQKRYGTAKPSTNTQLKQYRQFSHSAGGFTPNTSDVQHAYKEGHITHEEASALNPKWDPKKSYVSNWRSFRPEGEPANKKSSERPLAAPPGGKKPSGPDVARALSGGHITKEEADDLNPKHGKEYNRKRARTPRKYGTVFDPTPTLQDIHRAREGGHITSEEAVDLNPKYRPDDKRQSIQLRRFNKRKDEKASSTGRTPTLNDIHVAVRGGHISSEEGVGLNPNYAPNDPAKMKKLNSNLNKKESGYSTAYAKAKWQEEKASRQFKGSM